MVEPFFAELHAKSRERRREAAEVLVELGALVPLKQLLAALEHEDIYVRVQVCRALLNQKQRLSREEWERVATMGKELEQARSWGTLLRESTDVDESTGIEPLAKALASSAGKRQQIQQQLSQLREVVSAKPLLAALQKENQCGHIEHGEASIPPAQQVSTESLLAVLQNGVQWMCTLALHALWRQGEYTLVESLLAAPDKHFAWIRITALEVLSALGKAVSALPLQLLVVLLRDQHADIRTAAAWALGRLRKRSAIKPLIAALHDPHWSVRWAAVQALGELGVRAPIKPIQTASQDQHEEVRIAALAMLHKRGKYSLPSHMFFANNKPHKSRPPRYVLNDFSKYSVNLQLVQRLRKIDEIVELGTHAPVKDLLHDLQNDEEEASKDAATILKRLVEQGNQGVIEAIIPLIEHHEDPEQRARMVRILSGMGRHTPLALLEALLLHDQQTQVRIAAAYAFQSVLRRTDLETFIPKERTLRGVIGELIREVISIIQLEKHLKAYNKEHNLVDTLIAALQDESEAVRGLSMRALKYLEGIGTHIPSKVLLRALQDESKVVRQEAISLLASTHADIPKEAVAIALQDEDDSLRIMTISLLAERGNRIPCTLTNCIGRKR